MFWRRITCSRQALLASTILEKEKKEKTEYARVAQRQQRHVYTVLYRGFESLPEYHFERKKATLDCKCNSIG